MEILESVTSTMDEARERVVSGRVNVKNGFCDPSGIMAREQTSGRGQRGRVWHSFPGESLAATWFVPFNPNAEDAAAGLALIAGVAAAHAIGRFIGAAAGAPRVGLKWPNDITLNGRKVGGVLIEAVQNPDGNWIALVGIGINTTVSCLPPEIASFATSLTLERVKRITWEDLGREIDVLLPDMANTAASQGFDNALRQWEMYDETPGCKYYITEGDREEIGTARGVTPKGALILEMGDGTVREVTSASSVMPVRPTPGRSI